MPQRGRLVLTRRGRIVLAVLLVSLALVAVGLAAAAGAQAASSGASRAALEHSMVRVTVQPGQSLWSIALRVQPAADPRTVVQQIEDINALRGISIQPGQQLWVPKG